MKKLIAALLLVVLLFQAGAVIAEEGIKIYFLGNQITADVEPYIENSRTYLPVRFVAENLDAKVTWGGTDGSVTIVVE